MNRSIILVLLLASLSCKKSRFHSADDLIGKWELRISSGGIAGRIEYPPGNGNIVQFLSNGTYSYQSGGQTIDHGTYILFQGNTAGELILRTTNSTSHDVNDVTITTDSKTLQFLPGSPCCDIPTIVYSRI
jgi:hypothetical protein